MDDGQGTGVATVTVHKSSGQVKALYTASSYLNFNKTGAKKPHKGHITDGMG